MATKKKPGEIVDAQNVVQSADQYSKDPDSVPSIPDNPSAEQLEKDKEEQKQFKDYQKNQKAK